MDNAMYSDNCIANSVSELSARSMNCWDPAAIGAAFFDLPDDPQDGYFSNSVNRRRDVRQFSFDEMKRATNNFDEEMVLGSGGEGKVYKGVTFDDHTNTYITVAVKVFYPDRTLYSFPLEIIHTDLKHPNIVSVVGYCNESPDHGIVVYEYMDKGSLADNLRDSSTPLITWEQRLRIAIDVARALSDLHNGNRYFLDGIIHRDVKPENILLDESCNAKLSDFGSMKVCPPPPPRRKNSYLTQLKGTPGYIAPEYITNQRITNKVDVYSYGMVLFELLCGKSPWKCPGKESYYPQDDDNFGDLSLQNIDPNIILEISQDCLKVYTDLIGKTLRQNPAARPTMHQVVLELEIALKMQQQHDLQRSSSESDVPTDPPREDISRACHIESGEVISPTIFRNPLIL